MRRCVISILFSVVVLHIAQSAEAGSITLAWNPNPEPDIAGYVLDYGTVPGNYSHRIDVGPVTTAKIDSLLDSVVYYFALEAYNSSGLFSPRSAEVSGMPTPVLPPPIVITSLSADRTFPAVAGTTITWTTTATVGAAVEYQYWLWGTASGWVSQPYSTSNRFSWMPTDADAGNHQVQVDVRYVGISIPPVSQQTSLFTITAQQPPPTTGARLTSLTTNATVFLVGVPVQWTATASGGTAPLQYSFLRYDGGNWKVVQDWGTASTLSWTARKVGDYQIRVRVRSAGVTSGFDSELTSTTFTVSR